MRLATTPTHTDLLILILEVERLGSVPIAHFFSNDRRAPHARGSWYLGKHEIVSDIERICRMKTPYRLPRGTSVHWEDGNG